MRRAAASVCAGAAVAAIALTGCSSDSSGPPDFRPSPGQSDVEGGPGVRVSPILPIPSFTDPGAGGGSGPSAPGSSTAPGKQIDPLVVATKLRAPVGVTILPDNTALVGERTTGRIVRVKAQAGQPVTTVRTLTGLDTGGDGGLLDLALSPTYDEDNLIYAYITTASDNRVVAFTLDGPVTPVLTGIPKGATGNAGRLLVTADGAIAVGTGVAGRPSTAAQPSSLAGKVLRVTDIGRPASGSSPVFTRGHSGATGLCSSQGSTSIIEIEKGASGAPAEINLLAKGADYGYPTPSAGSRASIGSVPAAYGTPGGCAVLDNRLWLTSLDGKALISATLTTKGTGVTVGKFTAVLKNKYGRLRTVVAAADGALWITTSNRDGKGRPVAADERVIRYVPDANGGGTNPA